ncbi:MAG: eukaryotic-like serine/threonine-protein kinase [Rikenellaceae bacterium]|jgi:beta-lactam-binding protein with PASTA domain|nr:eukaryotic-like serine/threonine-protein kinase [Rikenellaceae bacterium]MDI3545322.1 eukaryotic-like serine/threonine-protein kinase [Rikenellaceae bacterium]MDN5355564.1 eukaryotic-like serine/threonine-protein kinase [Rikenellaceae bacterium]
MSNWQYLKTKTFWGHIGLMLVTFIVFIFLVKIFLNIYTRHGKEIELADYTNKSLEDIQDKTVDIIVIDSVFNEDLPPLTIVNQYPEPGIKVKPGRKVYVTVVSKSYEKVPLPDLTDITLRAATLQLQAYGFQIGKIEEVPSIGQTVIAVKQNGREIPWGTLLKKGSVVDLVIGSGMQEDMDTLQTNTEDDEQADIVGTVSKIHSM